MKFKALFLLILTPALFAFQTDGVLPWVTNNVQFKSTVVLNNANAHDAEVVLVATRADGSEEGSVKTVPALSQLVLTAAELFPTLGEGPGYAVSVTSPESNISAGFVVAGTGTTSGTSPAQSDMVPRVGGSPFIMFNYLPSGSGSSAPVIMNLGDSDASVVLRAYRGGALVASSAPITIKPGHPFADVTTNLFPNIDGDLFVVAEANQPLAGTAFIFNEQREPSMTGAAAINEVPATQPASETVVLDGIVVTGINRLMGDPLLDFGGSVGTEGFPTVGAYDDEDGANLTKVLSQDLLNNPIDVIMAAGAGLVPDNNDDFNANVPLHLVPSVTGMAGLFFARAALSPMLQVGQMDLSISEPFGPITLEDWLKAEGKLYMRCNDDQTAEVTITAKNLLPNRIYSLWGTFDNGFLNTVPFGGLPNAFTTDKNGDGQITRIINFCPTNPREGEAPTLLVDVVLHSDHMLYGGIPTASLPGKDAHAHLGFFFQGELLQKK